MNAINDPRVYMRSMATRENNVSVSPFIHSALNVLKLAHPDVIILETSGIGQSGSEVSDFADVSMYVMTPEYGASTQLEKIDMLDYADLVALNKSDKRGALDALQAVRKQFQRNHLLWESPLDDMPVFATKASQFNDHGTTELYNRLIVKVNETLRLAQGNDISEFKTFIEQEVTDEVTIIPPKRVRYLSEIVENNKQYDAAIEKQAELARTMYHIEGVKIISNDVLETEYQKAEKELQQENIDFLKTGMILKSISCRVLFLFCTWKGN